MSIVKKPPKAEKQLNIKLTENTHVRYNNVKDVCRRKGWEFSLQPEFESWLNTQLAGAEKELAAAEKAEAKLATQADASA